MRLSEFARVLEKLRPLGYAPTRCRPYAAPDGIRVAVILRRDFRPWYFAQGLTAKQVVATDNAWRANGFVPVEVAEYLSSNINGESVERYVAIWQLSGRGRSGDAQRRDERRGA